MFPNYRIDIENKKALTLIELLAVIVILAIIALIATPIILGVIENSRRKAFEDIGYGVVESIRNFYINKLSKEGVVGENTFTFPNSELFLSGTEPIGGKAKLYADGTIEIAIHNNSYCVTKGKDEDAVTSTPISNSSNSVRNIFNAGYVSNYSTKTNNSHVIRPTLYLKPSVKIISGDGKSASTAYILSI